MTPDRAVLLLVIGASLLRLVLAGITDLGLDEAYALAVSRQFQLSWFDHPPLLFWIVGATQALFGLEVPALVLRLPFIVLSAGTTWLLYRLAGRHFGDAAGLWAAVLFTAAPFFLLSAGSWLVPDGPLVFFLVLAALALTPIVLADDTGAHWRDWLLFGAAGGLALLSKYHAAIFVAGAGAYFALTPRLWTWLRRPQPYAALLLALAIFSPALVWNADNDWVSFAFQLGRGAPMGGTTPARIFSLFAFEAAYLLPTTALLLLGSVAWGIAGKSSRRAAWFFLALGAPTIIALELPRFWTWESFPHWPMPGWLLLFPIAGAMIAALQARWPQAGAIVAGVTGLQLAVAIGAIVLWLSSFRLDNPEVDAFRVEAGTWSAFAEGLEASGAIAPDDILVATSWRDASRVAEALRIPNLVLAFEANPHGFAWLASPAGYIGRDALIVTRSWDTPLVLASFAPYFESFAPVGNWPTDEGNRHTIDVTRGRLVAPYPMPYPRR